MRGNCYAASEALYHILGGKLSKWEPKVMRLPSGETHWFLQHKLYGIILDPSRRQFSRRRCQWTDRWTPKYYTARGCGFLTRRPSKRAKAIIQRLTWS